MLPLGFTDLASSSTIILSPHQHQFDPMTSRAAHSFYYPQPSKPSKPSKPSMPTRPWDHPVAMSKEAPTSENNSKKRNRDEEDDQKRDDSLLPQSYVPKTPYNTPENATQSGRCVPQDGHSLMDLTTSLDDLHRGDPNIETSLETEDGPSSLVKRQRLPNDGPRPDHEGLEDFISLFLKARVGDGWTPAENNGLEGDIFRDFTDVITCRFRVLPTQVQWIAKNREKGLLLARIKELVCYFDSSLSRCWLLAITPLRAKGKCLAGSAVKEDCEELFLCRYSGEPDGMLRLRLGESDKPFIVSRPSEWQDIDYMSRFDGLRGTHSQAPNPAADENTSSAFHHDSVPILSGDETTNTSASDGLGHGAQRSTGDERSSPVEAMEID